jgi:hypothetical protein
MQSWLFERAGAGFRSVGARLWEGGVGWASAWLGSPVQGGGRLGFGGSGAGPDGDDPGFTGDAVELFRGAAGSL